MTADGILTSGRDAFGGGLARRSVKSDGQETGAEQTSLAASLSEQATCEISPNPNNATRPTFALDIESDKTEQKRRDHNTIVHLDSGHAHDKGLQQMEHKQWTRTTLTSPTLT